MRVYLRREWRKLMSIRTVKLRINWFILGLVFGASLSNAFSDTSPLLEPDFTQPALTALDRSEPQETLWENASLPVASEAETADDTENESTPASLTRTLTLKSGDTMLELLLAAGAGYQEAHELITLLRKQVNLRSLPAGQPVTVTLETGLDSSPVVQSVEIQVSGERRVTASREESGKYALSEEALPLKREFAVANAEIRSSLFVAASRERVPTRLVAEMIRAFSYDVDFQRDIKQGDRFGVLYERYVNEEGKTVKYGRLLHASLTLGGKEMALYNHTRADGSSDYFNAKGESIRKSLLQTPINGARISSGFGMRRHPILGYSKMHKGVDFAAPTGTPIYAAGDGVVSFAGQKGGYGNYLSLRHNSSYSTAYAHISRFAKGVRPGARVRQGQVVAYVGTTGRSTGPHLHYEVLLGGAPVNPKSIKIEHGEKLSGRELARFEENIRRIHLALAGAKKSREFAANDQ